MQSERQHARNAALTTLARRRSSEKMAAAQRAITSLHAKGKEVTFDSVAAAAGCSVGYLYKNSELAARIKALRSEAPRSVGSRAASPSSEGSLRTKLEAATRRNRALEAEVARLRHENRSLLSRVLDER
jgi:glutamate 5-kinase